MSNSVAIVAINLVTAKFECFVTLVTHLWDTSQRTISYRQSDGNIMDEQIMGIGFLNIKATWVNGKPERCYRRDTGDMWPGCNFDLVWRLIPKTQSVNQLNFYKNPLNISWNLGNIFADNPEAPPPQKKAWQAFSEKQPSFYLPFTKHTIPLNDDNKPPKSISDFLLSVQADANLK